VEINFENFKIFATTWHALLNVTRISTHTVTSYSLIGRQIACHGVNPLTSQRDVCFNIELYWLCQSVTCVLDIIYLRNNSCAWRCGSR